MLNHSTSYSRTPSPSLYDTSLFTDGDYTFPPQQTDPLVQSFFSFSEESPASYDLLMSFTFPDHTSTQSEGEMSNPWLHLTSSWSSMETLYDTTPSEIEQQNYLDHLRHTPHPGRLYHVMNYGGNLLSGPSLHSNRATVDSSETEKQNKSKNIVTKLRSFVRRFKK
jgi:hypothetical protein